MSSKKTVVIIGYGVAGSRTAAALAKSKMYNVTVITPFNYQEVPLQMTKVVATGAEVYKGVVFDIIKEDGVEYKFATCKSINDKTITLSDDSNISFDVCVVATGINIPFFYPNPETEKTSTDRSANVNKMFEDVKMAKSIVISGGGPIGVETAGDIKLRFKDKKVTLVSSGPRILEQMPAEYSTLMSNKMKAIGINIILNDRVVSNENGKVKLSSGSFEDADLYIPCFAGKPNTTFMPSSSLDSKGYIKVDKTFKVEGMDGVFAVAACCNISNVKTIPHIDDAMPVFLNNVTAALDSQSPTYKSYTPGFMGKTTGPLMVALGHGVKDGYGVGPSLPAPCDSCCWFCCCIGGPCATPAGEGVAKMKDDFNNSIKPVKGLGINRT